MTAPFDLKHATIAEQGIEYRAIAGSDPSKPALVFLHEGLGSTALWRDFPDQLCAATGCAGLIYSRFGYGGSDPCVLPRPLDYMQEEATNILPALLAHFDIRNFILVGHSDGASIALVYAGLAEEISPKAVVVMAPHVFCEDISVAGIEDAQKAYEQGDLEEKLKKFHGINTECAFRGWNDAWLDPAFRSWNIETYLPVITAPVLAIQGREDSYGTLRQIEKIERAIGGQFHKKILDKCGHNPWQEKRDDVLAYIVAFIREPMF